MSALQAIAKSIEEASKLRSESQKTSVVLDPAQVQLAHEPKVTVHQFLLLMIADGYLVPPAWLAKHVEPAIKVFKARKPGEELPPFAATNVTIRLQTLEQIYDWYALHLLWMRLCSAPKLEVNGAVLPLGSAGGASPRKTYKAAVYSLVARAREVYVRWVEERPEHPTADYVEDLISPISFSATGVRVPTLLVRLIANKPESPDEEDFISILYDHFYLMHPKMGYTVAPILSDWSEVCATWLEKNKFGILLSTNTHSDEDFANWRTIAAYFRRLIKRESMLLIREIEQARRDSGLIRTRSVAEILEANPHVRTATYNLINLFKAYDEKKPTKINLPLIAPPCPFNERSPQRAAYEMLQVEGEEVEDRNYPAAAMERVEKLRAAGVVFDNYEDFITLDFWWSAGDALEMELKGRPEVEDPNWDLHDVRTVQLPEYE